jgi:hypothetical protein
VQPKAAMTGTKSAAKRRRNWEVQDMTSLTEAERKYGQVVQNAGGQVFGIERTVWLGKQADKLKIGTPDGFVTIDVVLNQTNIDAILRERTAEIVKHARELRTRSLPALGALASSSARK